MVYDPTAWVEGTPMNKYEFGDLTIATADIKCPSTGIIMIFKGTRAKVDSGAWNPVSDPNRCTCLCDARAKEIPIDLEYPYL
jgi:hypothetical protein